MMPVDVSAELVSDYLIYIKKLAPPMGAPALRETLKIDAGLGVTVLYRECD
jgi:hypothetical protein